MTNPPSPEKGRIFFPLAGREPETVRILLEAPVEQIAFLVATVESYGHLAIPRTVDRVRGVVELLATPDTAADARALVASLAPELGLTLY